MKKKFGLLMTIILSMLLLVACGGSGEKKEGGDAGAGTAKDTLVIAQGADAKSLDPHASMITHLQELEYKSMTD